MESTSMSNPNLVLYLIIHKEMALCPQRPKLPDPLTILNGQAEGRTFDTPHEICNLV